MENLKTVKNYAKLKGVSIQYIYKLLKQKKLKIKKIDGVIFIIPE